eukprot:TRINITY_DN27233_c0_g1_i1.p1 TRINITY_DN27233_c0_g1~~TRINITY_DN27233_c0_g1_i1.p1  ORF type:complete len:223 (+),score=42.31 TRINITY_DN27233_c0_g1_i1:73-741(+)
MASASAPWSHMRPGLRALLAAGLVALQPDAIRGIFFELKAQGTDYGKDCFQAHPGAGHALHGSYEADGPAEGVKVTLLSDDNKELWISKDSSGKFSVDIQRQGPHTLCFESSSSESQMVSFNFHVDEHGEGPDVDHKGGMEFVTKDHTDKVSELVLQLESKANDILDQQQYAITREAVHRETAESTNARVMWWTLLEVGVLIALAVFQAYYLRSYFEVKQIV